MEQFFFKLAKVIIDAGFVQGIFLFILLNTAKNRKNKSNIILSLLLLILSISIAHSIFVVNDLEGIQNSPLKIREPFILLIGPFIYFYIKELNSQSIKFDLKILLHTIPFIIFFIILIFVHFIIRNSPLYEFMRNYTDIISIIVWCLLLIQYGYYYIKIFHIIGIHRSKIESEFSNLEGVNLAWIKVFLSVFFEILIVLAIAVPIIVHKGAYTNIDQVITLTLSISIFILGYKGLFQARIFNNLNEEIVPVPAIIEESVPENLPSESSLQLDNNRHSHPSDEEAVQKLLDYMEQKKPYLNEALTLTGLAKELKMTRNRLSQLINNDIGDNFYNFINKYRVEEVKKYISSPNNKNYTILALAYEAGFPSKSSFNSIFKKFTGLTPSEYKEKLN
jgi:AraC-like DNA-binding protein